MFSSSSLENVILCPPVSFCLLNIYGFPRLLWPATSGKKGTRASKKVSFRRGRSTVSSKSELLHILTSVKLSFNLTCVCVHTRTYTPHMCFELLLSKSQLDSLSCQRIVFVGLLVLGEKSEGLRRRGIIDVYI